MKKRKLRIAWSVVCGAAAVGFAVLGGRSFSHRDSASVGLPGALRLNFISMQRRVELTLWNTSVMRPAIKALTNHEFLTWHSARIAVVYPGTPEDVAEEAELPEFPGFRFKLNSIGGFEFVCPHWFQVLGFGFAAALPWVRWSWRFGLRTILVVMTAVAVALGVIAWLR